MIDKPTKEEISLMDKIFLHKLDCQKKSIRYDSNWYCETYNIESDAFDYIIRLICEYGEQLRLLTFERFSDSSLEIVRLDDIMCSKFIIKGGFNTYFHDLKPKHWISKTEFKIPFFVGIFTVALSSVAPLYIWSQEKKTDIQQEKRIEEILDSVNTSYRNQYHHHALQTKKEVLYLLDSLNNSSLDSIKH